MLHLLVKMLRMVLTTIMLVLLKKKKRLLLMLMHDIWSCDFVWICLMILFILVYDFVLHKFSNEVMSDINVLSPIMLNRIFRNINSTQVVTE